MKNPILYTITAAALAAVAAIAIVGCDGDFGERSENMDYFLDKFSGKSNRYTITFNANGASKGSPPQPIDVIKDSTTNLPSNTGGLSKTGFYFGGWSEDSLGKYGNHVTGGQYTPKSNVMLYAIWLSEDGVRRIVTVVSVGAGSSGSGEYESDTTVRIDAGTAPEGQQFQNWKSAPSVTFANSNSPTTTFTMPRENVTVKANFGAVTEGKYAVT
ncbi:MAG: InlB B-repeat-containing protein, partial [Chitinispirillales bacterium]|nr:InlB B-repeat-containing protein [Chitinispirillales bacterium]